MKVLNAKVNWMYDYANDPTLWLHVDKIPSMADMVFEEIAPHLFYAERDGYVEFFYYQLPGLGYGGRAFELTMKDGTKKVLLGPWSSSASTFTYHGKPCLDVTFYGGLYHYAGHITLQCAIETLKLIKEPITLTCIDSYGRPIWVPMPLYNSCRHDDQDKAYQRNGRCSICHHKLGYKPYFKDNSYHGYQTDEASSDQRHAILS